MLRHINITPLSPQTSAFFSFHSPPKFYKKEIYTQCTNIPSTCLLCHPLQSGFCVCLLEKKLPHEWEIASNPSLLSSQALHPLTCLAAVEGLFPSRCALINFCDEALSCSPATSLTKPPLSFSVPISFLSCYKYDIVYGYTFLNSSLPAVSPVALANTQVDLNSTPTVPLSYIQWCFKEELDTNPSTVPH